MAIQRKQCLRACQADQIQELGADDILALDKIEKQLAALREGIQAGLTMRNYDRAVESIFDPCGIEKSSVS